MDDIMNNGTGSNSTNTDIMVETLRRKMINPGVITNKEWVWNVCDVMLCMAKDERYIECLKELARDVWASIMSDNENVFRNESRTIFQQYEPELEIICRWLYHLLTMGYFDHHDYDYSRRRRPYQTCGMEALNLHMVQPIQDLTTTTESTTTTSPNAHHRLSLSSLVTYLSLSTIPTYIVQRSLRRPFTSASSNPFFLTGSARRQIFHQQRQRASQYQQQRQQQQEMTTEPSSIPTTISRPTNNNSQNNNNNNITNNVYNNIQTGSKRAFLFISKKVKTLMWAFLLKLNIARQQLGPSMPHSLPSNNNQNNNNQVQMDRWTALLKWCMRLHTATFYIYGLYPTWSHRIANLSLASHSSNQYNRNDTIINANRPKYTSIAAIIALHGVAKALKATSQLTMDTYNYMLLQPSTTTAPTTTTCDNNNNNSMNENRMIQEINRRRLHLENMVPSAQQQYQEQVNPASSNQQPTCAICMHPRNFPAASKHCGHVFCWDCLIQSCNTSQPPSCPLCRTPCQKKDLVALYQYS